MPPQWRGEPEPGLWHFSEQRDISEFVPRPSPRLGGRLLVWAVDTRHSPLFWFPRDCPRITFWTAPTTTQADRERFFGSPIAEGRIHGVEDGWWERVRTTRLFAYRLPPASFFPEGNAVGYWVCAETVHPLEGLVMDDLIHKHAEAGIGLRAMGSLWPLWHEVIRSSLGFSGCRLTNARTVQPPDLLP